MLPRIFFMSFQWRVGVIVRFYYEVKFVVHPYKSQSISSGIVELLFDVSDYLNRETH